MPTDADQQRACRAMPYVLRSIQRLLRVVRRWRRHLLLASLRSCAAHAPINSRPQPGTPSETDCRTIACRAVFHLANYKCEFAARSGAQRLGQDRENRQRHFQCEATLFCLDRCYAIANVLATKPHGIPAAKPGIEKHVEPNALACPYRPVALIGRDLFFGPNRKSTILRSRWVFNSDGRVSSHQRRLGGPFEQPPHCLRKCRA